MDDQQRAMELLAIHLEAEGYFIAEQIRAGNVPTYELVVIKAITAALRAAPEVEVVGEAWRLVDSDGGQFGELYNSEWDASVAQLKWQGDRTVSPFTVQRLELIAARPQGVKS